VRGTFRSLRGFNYRLWAAGSLVSNVGTWMQRTGQAWLVLTELTDRNATAVGVVTALQFAPQILLLPLAGFAADHMDRRKLLFATQGSMGALALALGLLTITGRVELWHVYVFAFLFGCATALDSPVRQTFVGELVGEEHLANAVALNSTSFNAARVMGPALAGVTIAAVGTGWAFLLNAASFVAVLVALARLRVHELHAANRTAQMPGRMADGFRYVWQRPELAAAILMMLLIGTFGLNFPIFISTMAVSVFQQGASEFGFLTSVMAVGSVAGALFAASRGRPTFALLFGAAVIFGLAAALAAAMPDYELFGAVLVIVGVAAQIFTTSTNALVQMSTDPGVRGRVVAIFLAAAMGGQPLGAPVVGWVADRFGPRWALTVGAASGLAAACVALRYLARRPGDGKPVTDRSRHT
jgi:MFS family permease